MRRAEDARIGRECLCAFGVEVVVGDDLAVESGAIEPTENTAPPPGVSKNTMSARSGCGASASWLGTRSMKDEAETS